MTNTAPTPSASHVLDVYKSATPEQITSGLAWYSDALLIADALAEKYFVTRRVAVGVIAALSPLNSWGANLNLAARFLAEGGLHTGYLGHGLAKGRAMLSGEDPLNVLTSEKVQNFYLCILSGGADADAVCVDRHAYSIAVNERTVEVPSLTPKRYEALANVYREAARVLGVTPAQVQAITWGVWRRRFWSEGAWDGHTVEV